MPTDPRDEIKDRFAAGYEEQEPSFDAAIGTATADIVARRQRAAARFGDMANVVLTPEQQQAFGGKRIPGLDHIADVLGAALAGSRDIEKVLGFTGRHLREGALQDRAAGRVVMAGQMLSRGGDNGCILTAATMDALCERVLDKARAALRDPALSSEQRSDAEIAFSEPFRLEQAARAKKQAQKDQLAAAARLPLQQIDRAAEELAKTRLIDAFMTSLKKPGGGA